MTRRLPVAAVRLPVAAVVVDGTCRRLGEADDRPWSNERQPETVPGTKGDVPNPFPSLDKRQMMRVLRSLGYEEIRCKGSHRRLAAEGRPSITFAAHDGSSLAPSLVREILVKQVGLTIEEALKVVQGDD